MPLPRRIPLCRSRRLGSYLVALHVVASIGLGLFPWPVLIKLCVTAALMASLAYCLRPLPVLALRLGIRGDLLGVFSDDSSQPLVVLPSSAVFASLVVLHLRSNTGPVVLPLLRDSFVESDDFRLLRVWLRSRAIVGAAIGGGDEA